MKTDLIMYQWGEEVCAPAHFYGPAVRDHYLIHYILDGKGVYQEGEKSYTLSKGQGFLISPDAVTYYQADEKEPWHYIWVGFYGLQAEVYVNQCGLSQQDPIFHFENSKILMDYLQKMRKSKEILWGRENYIIGYLHLFLSALMEESHQQGREIPKVQEADFYVKAAVDFISKNYSRKITIQDMADHVGLHRSYIYTLFKKELHLSPQQFLIQFRMIKARELIEKDDLPIGYIAHSVGYEDPLLFSKIFKGVMGKSPSQYRK